MDITNLPVYNDEDDCLPAVLKRAPGRPRVRRFKKGEWKSGRLNTAARTGDDPDDEILTQMRRHPRQKCSQCGEVGHKRNTCNEPVRLGLI